MTKKINNSLIALLLLATTFNSHSMEQQQAPQWTAVVGDIILGTASLTILSQPNESSGFTSLPLEMHYKIIQLLGTNTTTTTLKEAAFTINSLAQVNKELNEFINNPQFCLSIIKHLAQKFNCSDQKAAEALQTHEAKRRLDLQKQLYQLCENPHNAISLEDLYHADLTFTYTSWPQTLLMQAITCDNMTIIRQLIMAGADINQSNNQGFTAIMVAMYREYPKIIAELIKNNNIKLNQRSLTNLLKGNTALMIGIYQKFLPGIKILLDVGADPEVANNNGITPLQAAQQTGNQEVIDLIQDAIDNPTSPRLRRAQAKGSQS